MALNADEPESSNKKESNFVLDPLKMKLLVFLVGCTLAIIAVPFSMNGNTEKQYPDLFRVKREVENANGEDKPSFGDVISNVPPELLKKISQDFWAKLEEYGHMFPMEYFALVGAVIYNNQEPDLDALGDLSLNPEQTEAGSLILEEAARDENARVLLRMVFKQVFTKAQLHALQNVHQRLQLVEAPAGETFEIEGDMAAHEED